jgi:hypothetical protein
MAMQRSSMILFVLTFVLTSVCFVSHYGLCAPQESKETFLFDPSKNVGKITPGCSETDLIAFYGAKNIQHAFIEIGEGETVQGSVLFSGTPDAVKIEWKEEYKFPWRITISSKGTHWHTKEGIAVGISLEALEKINGGPFKLTGFGWDYGGRTISWENGNLPRQLQIDLTPTKKVSESEYQSVSGDRDFISSNPVMKKLGLTVENIFIRWD